MKNRIWRFKESIRSIPMLTSINFDDVMNGPVY